MASPAQIPAARPPRSFAGPVVLIIVGIIFLLGNLRMLRWEALAHTFAHYWPLLLIIWGVIKLLEYQQAQRNGTRAPGIGVGGVFLLIFIIVFGIASTQASHFNWSEIRDQMHMENGDFPLFGHSYNYDDNLDQAFPAGGSLRVTNERGAVNVNAATDNQIHVSVHKRISADNQQEADKWNPQTKPQISVSGPVVTLNANTHGAGDHWVSTDMDISIPRKASLIISTRHGDINVMGREGDAGITSEHGDVSVTDIAGNVSLNLDHSSARVSKVTSDVSVDGRANDVSLEDIKGTVRLSGDFMESLKLAKIAKPVEFKSSRTEMAFNKLDGDLDLDSGDLQMSNVVGPLRITTRSKDVRINGAAGDVRLQDENGAVEIRVSKLGSLQVENRQGDIRIFLPDKAAFQVDAHARNGEIQSDFAEIKIDSRDDQASASGTVGSGGPRMVLNNEHGAIEIRKGSSMAEDMPAIPKIPHAPRAPHVPDPHSPPEPDDN